ncbi:hypothetical protein [Methylotenera sp.]|uniref:hypothetical protein n=1 Tax=Methylotenera sp. TaxID=2051956 RepID=UPI002ED91806
MTQTNNEREVIELNDIALKQQSEAWLAVFHVLNEVKPNWLDSNLPAMGCAVNAIKELAKSPISQNEHQEVATSEDLLKFLKTHGAIDEEGYEYGIAKIKFDSNGKPLSVLWTDVETVVALKKRLGII